MLQMQALQYPYSLQILLSVVPVRQYHWFIYQGPQGIAVDPCQDHDGQMPEGFKRVFYGTMFNGKDDDINHPPFPDRKVSGPPIELEPETDLLRIIY
ncbi:hypothetical protein ACET3X_003528 [Alternaria dauci]|uniref:Uncharacterized protein n=1 Tax=Alternaria dauci TaxID=48095 RepID=A0ABR3UVR3_9PLEO